MYSNIENQENNFKNIQSFLNRNIRDEMKEVSSTLHEINENLNKKAR